MKNDLIFQNNFQNNIYLKRNKLYFLALFELVHEFPMSYFSMIRRKGFLPNNSEIKREDLNNWINSQLPILSDSFFKISTKCFWILHGLEDFPRCSTCGKKLNNINVKLNSKYPSHCCRSCAMRDKDVRNRVENTCEQRYGEKCFLSTEEFKKKLKITSLQKFGTDFPQSSQIIKDKIAQTSLERYGNRCSLHGKDQKEKTKQKLLDKYAVDNPSKAEAIKTKIKETKKNFSFEKKNEIERKKTETCLKHFGVNHQFKSPSVRESITNTMLKRYGREHFTQTQEFKNLMSDPTLNNIRMRKQFETKIAHKTFNTSSAESECFELLKQKFGSNNVETQFISEKYPFHCDFYIKNLDLYIELNAHWSHGGHFFDENNDEDLNKVEFWKSKNSKYYKNCIYTWTVLDVKKMKCAIENRLHYLVFWSKDEMASWARNLKISR